MRDFNLIALLLASLVVFSTTTAISQNTTFKLSDYKNPEYLYQTLDLNFGLNSGLTTYKYKTTDKSGMNNFSMNTGAGGRYSLYKNSPSTQTELQSSFKAGIESQVYHSTFESLKTETNSNTFSHFESLDIEGLKRFYNAKQNYFEVNGIISGNYNNNSNNVTDKVADTIYSQYNHEVKQLNLNISGGLLIGKGRIEQVQDARMAMYLIEDLQKLDRQSRMASNEEILALAGVITKLKYKRFFDNRLRKIAEITAIDSFLQKNGIAATIDATYFTSLNDNWNYANNPVRNSGKRIFAGIEADYFLDNESRSFDNKVPDEIPSNEKLKFQNTGAFLIVGATYEKPTSLKWQNSANLKIGFGFRQVTSHLDLNDTNFVLSPRYTESFPSMKLSGNYGFGYYPTSRTWVTFNWWFASGWNKEMEGTSKQDKKDSQNNFYAYTGPQFQAFYYLSEKLRLSLTFTGELLFNKDTYTYEVTEGNPDKNTSTRWNHQVNAALTYSLF